MSTKRGERTKGTVSSHVTRAIDGGEARRVTRILTGRVGAKMVSRFEAH